MAMASGIYGPFLRDAINNAKAFALNASDTIDFQFVADAYTPDFNAHDEEADITNEVTGTGYTTGGVALGSPTFTIASGFATFDAADVSLSTTTLASVEGVVLFDDTLTGDPLLAAVDFGTPYSTTAGTFAITWNASGIFRIDYTP
jgi:hypothetical protein